MFCSLIGSTVYNTLKVDNIWNKECAYVTFSCWIFLHAALVHCRRMPPVTQTQQSSSSCRLESTPEGWGISEWSRPGNDDSCSSTCLVSMCLVGTLVQCACYSGALTLVLSSSVPSGSPTTSCAGGATGLFLTWIQVLLFSNRNIARNSVPYLVYLCRAHQRLPAPGHFLCQECRWPIVFMTTRSQVVLFHNGHCLFSKVSWNSHLCLWQAHHCLPALALLPEEPPAKSYL